jgi:hypothetical protein
VFSQWLNLAKERSEAKIASAINARIFIKA